MGYLIELLNQSKLLPHGMLRRVSGSEPAVRRRLAVGERVRDSGTLAGEPGVGSGVVEGALVVVYRGSWRRMVVLWGWVLCLFLSDSIIISH